MNARVQDATASVRPPRDWADAAVGVSVRGDLPSHVAGRPIALKRGARLPWRFGRAAGRGLFGQCAHRGLQVILHTQLIDQAELGLQVVDVLLGVFEDVRQNLP